jgi:hypothetical protein
VTWQHYGQIMRQWGDGRAPEQGSLWLRLGQRRRDWLAQRRASRNQQLLDAGRLLADDGEAERDPEPPVTDVFSWLGRNPR